MLFVMLTVILTTLGVFYSTTRYNKRYWKKRGAVFHSKDKFVGVSREYFFTDRAAFEIFGDIYKMYPNEPAVGIGAFFSPGLFVRDPVNIQHILQADFNAFNHKAFDANKDDILADNLLFMNGQRWKLLRQKLTPLFTSLKLKNMYYIINRGAEDFIEYLKNNPEHLKGDAFEIMSTYSCAAIGASVFGLGTESIFESPFLKMAQNAFKPTLQLGLKFFLSSISAPLFKFLGIKLFAEHQDFFVGAIKQVIRCREQESLKKYDFADMCVNIQKHGVLKDSSTGLEIVPTDELMAGQAFFFFVAGVEPCATAMFNTLVELGNHPEILYRVHEEIDEAFEISDGNITYDIVSNLTYLDMVLSEALRLLPPIAYLNRLCIKDSVLPIGNIQVAKATKVSLPIFEIHHDPKYYPNPEKFDPERFSLENRGNISDNIYMPFGRGPRICIGARYALIQILTGLVHFLRTYTVKTVIHGDKYKFKKEFVAVRLSNVSVEFIPRETKY